jgi:hypothetical protein
MIPDIPLIHNFPYITGYNYLQLRARSNFGGCVIILTQKEHFWGTYETTGYERARFALISPPQKQHAMSPQGGPEPSLRHAPVLIHPGNSLLLDYRCTVAIPSQIQLILRYNYNLWAEIAAPLRRCRKSKRFRALVVHSATLVTDPGRSGQHYTVSLDTSSET